MTNVPPGWISVRSSGWLSASHNLTEVDLTRCLAQLARALQPLHREDRVYARVSPDDVFIDADGMLRIEAGWGLPADTWVKSEALHGVNQSGFAAFEQYAHDPAWPQGPWTDIYGMCALARTLILKQSPPDAVQRMVSDTCEPLQGMALPAYSHEFLGIIDRGMSLLPQLRFSSIDDFSDMLGVSQLEPGAQEQYVAAAPASEIMSVAQDVVQDGEVAGMHNALSGPAAKKAPVWMIGLVAAILIALGTWWLRGVTVDAPITAAAPAQDIDTATEPHPGLPSLVDTEPSNPAQSLSTASADEQPLVAQPAAPPEPETQQSAALSPAPVAADTVPKRQLQESPVPADIKSVNVQLSIKPWGEVFIDGASRGVSPPVKTLSLKPGRYRVRVVNGDLPPYQQQLTVQADKPTAISHSFE